MFSGKKEIYLAATVFSLIAMVSGSLEAFRFHPYQVHLTNTGVRLFCALRFRCIGRSHFLFLFCWDWNLYFRFALNLLTSRPHKQFYQHNFIVSYMVRGSVFYGNVCLVISLLKRIVLKFFAIWTLRNISKAED